MWPIFSLETSCKRFARSGMDKMPMFCKENRIRNNKEFKLVYKYGRSYANRLLVLYVMPRSRAQCCRAGFSVGKKFGGAVERNKIKRQLREIFRLHLHALHGGNDLIFVVRYKSRGVTYKNLEEALLDLVRRARIFTAEKKD